MAKFGLYSTRVLIDSTFVEATVIIEDNKIINIHSGFVESENVDITNYGDYVIMPGLIDSHVHINEPGRTDWEGFDTATRAAAAGGITTLVDMPLNSSPVTTNANHFRTKIKAAQKNVHVNCGFWGGLIPTSHSDLQDLLDEGVLGVKVFLTHSGIDDFPNVSFDDLEKAAPILKQMDCVLLAHCELDSAHQDQYLLDENPTSYQAYLKSRPRKWENDAIKAMIAFCKSHKIKTHIVHLSSSDAIAMLQEAKKEELPITIETCPHYLYFNSETIKDEDTSSKCAPPIRETANNQKLWSAMTTDLIDFVVTDHSPAPPFLKEIESGNFKKAWGGIASLQLSLAIMTRLAYDNQYPLPLMIEKMSMHVAKFLQLDHRKGSIAKGYDADLVIYNPDESFKVKKEAILHKHKITPYVEKQLNGRVVKTFVNGTLVYDNGNFIHLNQGELILKNKN